MNSSGEPTEADGLMSIAHALHKLGVADASTPFGALEALGMSIEKAAARIAHGLDRIADAIEETAK